ncbi:hypothetical protein [Burkholderia thailandensis]|uniref:hypothetical protein n=1 Tax=Burkholderia thailandensis TaxID=57975 RepID=UPI001E4CF2F3|nr:hypothetical protein [Burkholderia thailandensis]
MKDRVEIDSREKKSAKKRAAIRSTFSACGAAAAFPRRGARAARHSTPIASAARAAARYFLRAGARRRRSFLPAHGRAKGFELIIRFAIARRNIRKYFQISCEYFCL